MRIEPVATYRVQLRPGFGFDETKDILPYFRELGISHVYTSPYLQATAGSTHGYDVVDPGRVNEELGGADGHAALCRALQTAGLGHMLDIVPNHMAIAGGQNPWWWDVLKQGPSSRFATYFDVDWEASDERWPNKVLLPVLGDHYGRILEDGRLRLSHDCGTFTLHHEEHVFPVDPSSLGDLLARAAASCGSEVLAFLAESHARLPRPTTTARSAVERRHRDAAVLTDLLTRLCIEVAEVGGAIDAEVARLNEDPDALDRLVDQQNYRLAFWRTASRDLGYRRFFDIRDLAGLRVEDPEVFLATHALPIAWVRKGWVQGLRIDHPDGLRNPGEYFARLRESCPETWIVAEKILEPGEELPRAWPIEGTTGYDFLNLVGGLFVDRRGEAPLTDLYRELTGEDSDFEAVGRVCKRLVLRELLASELNRISSLFVDVCERHRRYRDYTRHDLREALCETVVHFPVYRSYFSKAVPESVRDGLENEERKVVEAIQQAIAHRPDLDPELFGFLRDLLILRIGGSLEEELAMRFQQLTGSVMAKGVEDTAFYRFHRLTALNEVGGDPGRFGVLPEEFHQACAKALDKRPFALLASTTHDTKRSEDVRARQVLLSEIPHRWAHTVRRWCAHNERHRQGDLPDRNTEYLFYQPLVGAWPIDEARVLAYMEKAIREAKAHTSWRRQDEVYERAVRDFVVAVLDDGDFVAELDSFVSGLVEAGRINSLAQTLIKLTAPGVPDIYQGTELWDLSLVDPDNRRPVDFALRRRLLDEVVRQSPEEILARMDEGLPHLWLIRQALHLRRKSPELFGPHGSYRPLKARGRKADHVIAFSRGECLISIAPRLVLGLADEWMDTTLALPEGRWTNVLTGDWSAGGPVRLHAILSRFPVALLFKEDQ